MIRWLLTAGLFAALGTASAQDCALCHSKESETVAAAQMTQALHRASDSDFLKDNPSLSFRSGNFSYSIRREGNQSIYSVTDGTNTITAPLEWAFGAGVAGQTYLYLRDGSYYEASVSFFPETKSLDWTPGVVDRLRRNLEEAAGRKIDQTEAHRCFGCHSTSTTWSGTGALQSVTPGVQCVQCHAGGQEHAKAVMSGNSRAVMPKLSRLKTEELGNVCSKCHPSWADIATNGPHDVMSLRFQFYRLSDSRCYDSADTRIACTACHPPHEKLGTDQAFYDSRCQRCHTATNAKAKLCPVSKQDCITCHMPKVELPGLHHRFTDHQIRVVRAAK